MVVGDRRTKHEVLLGLGLRLHCHEVTCPDFSHLEVLIALIILL